jgi:Acetyltransferase (GNAT) domain
LHSCDISALLNPAPSCDILSPSNTPQFLRGRGSDGDKLLVREPASNVGEPYSATLLSSAAAIRLLADKAKLLLEQHRTWHPDFFLAAVSDKHWKPLAAAVIYNNRVAGIFYAKERLFCGCRTGIVYSDTTLGLNVVSEPVHREHVLNVAVGLLLTSGRARALRLVVPRDGFNIQAVSRFASSVDMDTVSFQVANHRRLALPSSYDDFLNGLRARTRRNFRYYRRRFEATGGQYIRGVPLDTFRSAARRLSGKSTIRAEVDGIERALKMLSAIGDPALVGLQAADGEWLSVAGGWCENGRATLLFQMNNDREYHRDSLSQVLRSYLIEELISRGTRDIVFWAGTTAPLVRYAERIPALALYVDSRSPAWRLLRRIVSSIAARLPRPWREFGHWITPESGQDDAVPSAGVRDD